MGVAQFEVGGRDRETIGINPPAIAAEPNEGGTDAALSEHGFDLLPIIPST
jgi:hypothetical protein